MADRGIYLGEKEVGVCLGYHGESMNRADIVPASEAGQYKHRGMDKGEKEVGVGLGNHGESMNRAEVIPASEAGPYKPRFADHSKDSHLRQQPPAVVTRTRKREQPYRRQIDYTNPGIVILKPIDWSKVKWSSPRVDPNTVVQDVLASIGNPLAYRRLNEHLEPLEPVYINVNEKSYRVTIHVNPAHSNPLTLRIHSASKRPTMPPGNEEQNHHAQNAPTHWFQKQPNRGGMTSGGFRFMNAALDSAATSGYFKRSFEPTPHNLQGPSARTSASVSGMNAAMDDADTSGYFKRSFEPTPRNVQGLSSKSFEPPRQQYDPRPQQHPTMSNGLRLAQSWDLQPRTWETPYQSPYKSADFGTDGTSMSLLNRHPSPQQEASTPLQPQESSVSTVLKSVTPVSFHGQNDITRTDSRSLVEIGSGSEALSSSRLQQSLNPGLSAPRGGRPPGSFNFFIEIPNVTPQKRGRPPKNTEQKTSANPNPKKRGRPFKVRTQLEIPVPEPEYIPFICEWKGCPAELQNLETLEAHVFNVHSRKQPSGNRICLWGKCGAKHETDKAVDSQPQYEPNEFRIKAQWKDHVNQQHLIPVAWHMGDGPKGTSLAIKPKSDTAPWLMDDNGRQVTPSVKDQRIEEGRAKENNAKRFNRKVEGIYWVYERIESP